jgi:hypothetical protein
MHINPKLANAIYVGFPLLWSSTIALGRSNYIDEFFGHLVAALLFPVLICATLYTIERRRKGSFYWQRWFFWTGLLFPAFIFLQPSPK